jgi:polyisoprenyl-phosphate glycosyltransferase
MPSIWVVTPSYCDVPAFEAVRKRTTEILDDQPELAGFRPRFVLIDDTAGLDPEVAGLDRRDDTQVVLVPFNLGHQRALVFGVRTLAGEMAADDLVVTLDSDGQDRPEDLPRLLAPVLASRPEERLVALARRTERPESLGFRLGYLVFRCVFRLLTGTVVRTGNFAAYRPVVAQQVLQHPHFDLCYSSSFISLDGPLAFVPCARGERLAGRSRMNRTRLGIHGIRMLMPFLDRIAIRMLAYFAALFGLSLAALVATLIVRFLTDTAIPGWATYTALGALIVSLVSLGNFVLLFATFAQSRGISLINLEQTVGRHRA